MKRNTDSSGSWHQNQRVVSYLKVSNVTELVTWNSCRVIKHTKLKDMKKNVALVFRCFKSLSSVVGGWVGVLVQPKFFASLVKNFPFVGGLTCVGGCPRGD